MTDKFHVYEAISAVIAEMSQDGIGKTRKNQQQGYSFRGIDEVLNALSPMLAKHKLCIIPRVLERTEVERRTAQDKPLFYVSVKAEFDFVSSIDGSKHTASTFGEAMDSADKATNKAMSAAYKYAAFQTFCIPTEGDNDADATTHAVAPKPRAVKQGENVQDDEYNRYRLAIPQAKTHGELNDLFADAWGKAKGDKPAREGFKKLYDKRKAELAGVNE